MSPSLTQELLCGDFDDLIEVLKKGEKGHMIGTTDMCGIHTIVLIKVAQGQKKIFDRLEQDSEERKKRIEEVDHEKENALRKQIADMEEKAKQERKDRRETIQWAVGTSISLSVVIVPFLFYIAKNVF